MQKGYCAVCGTVKTKFMKSGTGIFNKVVNKLPFELHLPGHNFTGPGTRLDKRLNPDMTPKIGVNLLIESIQPLITTTYAMQKI